MRREGEGEGVPLSQEGGQEGWGGAQHERRGGERRGGEGASQERLPRL